MNDGGIDAAFVHQDDGLLGGEGRHLSMREVGWQAASPQVDLGVNDLHRFLSVYFLQMRPALPGGRSHRGDTRAGYNRGYPRRRTKTRAMMLSPAVSII